MANLNKVMLIGRLCRDPESRTFANGGKVVSFGFAVNNRKKNASTGQWEEVPVFLDVEAFNRGEFGRLADLCEQHLKKGSQCFIEGSIRMDEWTDKTSGQKRSKIKIVVENVQFLDARQSGSSGGGAEDAGYHRPAASARRNPPGGGVAEPEDTEPVPF